MKSSYTPLFNLVDITIAAQHTNIITNEGFIIVNVMFRDIYQIKTVSWVVGPAIYIHYQSMCCSRCLSQMMTLMFSTYWHT